MNSMINQDIVVSARRSADFATSGEYNVTIGEVSHVIYRSPDNGWWYESVPMKHFSVCWIGFNKKEALATLVARYTAAHSN